MHAQPTQQEQQRQQQMEGKKWINETHIEPATQAYTVRSPDSPSPFKAND